MCLNQKKEYFLTLPFSLVLFGKGITLLMPRLEEGKAKIAENEEILETAKSILIKNKLLENKKVLITAGRTVEYLDPVRVLTNNSTGKMGMALACKALSAGAEVTVVYGKGTVTPPQRARVLPAETAENMRDAVFDELKNSGYDVFIAAAAVGDWRPKRQSPEKISSHTHKSITVELEPTPKIIDGVKKISVKTFLVAFRALYNLSRNELIENAYGRLLKANADLIAVNDVSIEGAGFETDTNELYIIDAQKKIEHIPLTTKEKAASRIIEIIAQHI